MTDKGRSLGQVLKEIADWGICNIAGTEARMKMNL